MIYSMHQIAELNTWDLLDSHKY